MSMTKLFGGYQPTLLGLEFLQQILALHRENAAKGLVLAKPPEMIGDLLKGKGGFVVGAVRPYEGRSELIGFMLVREEKLRHAADRLTAKKGRWQSLGERKLNPAIQARALVVESLIARRGYGAARRMLEFAIRHAGHDGYDGSVLLARVRAGSPSARAFFDHQFHVAAEFTGKDRRSRHLIWRKVKRPQVAIAKPEFPKRIAA